MASVVGLAKQHFGQNISRNRPQISENAAGQDTPNYGSTTDVPLNVVIIKNYLKEEQKLQGVELTFPAKLIGDSDLDIKDFDLIVTPTETFQVKNAQIKANNITGTVGADTPYFYCDLVYFDNNIIIEN